ncbi:hypothetical protein OR1_03690 [Geobacter sp. OR-1]|uniref:hypothetical protein n=1 Tax=Geobacter sp. OR-1 TaxID=1266765 RepID=UPI000543A86F|nr:hypothetical protein [Geobacter sp. OR-1]GAM11375.1 hypothetical protein OR1_03690 [Geobacter sp. OR-1]
MTKAERLPLIKSAHERWRRKEQRAAKEADWDASRTEQDEEGEIYLDRISLQQFLRGDF